MFARLNIAKKLTFASKRDKEFGNSPVTMIRNSRNGKDKKLL